MSSNTRSTDRVLSAPYPWFGGKSIAAPLIWERLGAVDNFVDPFFGSGAVLLGAPRVTKVETVNDKDGFVCCVWRAIQRDPDAVAHYADSPVNESDLHARHAWLNARRGDLTAQLEGDPDYYDAKIAGWWIWGCCLAIGGAWCTGKGAWRVVDGLLLKMGSGGDDDEGQARSLPHLGPGRGVHRVALEPGIQRSMPSMQRVGIHRSLPNIGGEHGKGAGVAGLRNDAIYEWMRALCERLRYVRVCCGDWTRILGPTPTTGVGLTGVVLDPPYAADGRCEDVYACDDVNVSADVRKWALEHGEDPLLRVVLCGYAEEHDMPGWTRVAWKAKGGYGNQRKDGTNDNAHRETIWFSPHCLKGRQGDLFATFGSGVCGD